MNKLLVIFLIFAATTPLNRATFEKEELEWRKQRAQRLTAPDSWLSLVGLDWLNEGRNTLKIPGGAAGSIVLQKGRTTLEPAANSRLMINGKAVTKPVELANDFAPGGPTIVKRGSAQFEIIKRNDRYAVRVKDANSEARRHFKGLAYFPADPKWRIVAKFEPYKPAKKIPITNVLGMTSDEVSPGALVFTVNGKQYRVDPILEQGETDLFLIFKDQTSRDATYQAARYVYAHPPGADGTTILDFNHAYNPPCVFTPYATCPLPPKQNLLPIRIEAGEKRYAGSHH